MSNSGERINYSLRPAKAVERQMLCEVFRRLYAFQPIETYGYVGFGSIYFSDFLLFHRALGISDLTSIERDKDNEERFRLNLPYGCIKLRMDESSIILPTLDWTTRKIVWLDYDGKLDRAILSDIATVTNKAISGSMIAISVNAKADPEPTLEYRQLWAAKHSKDFDISEYRLQEIKDLLLERTPSSLSGRELRGDGVSATFHQVIMNEIAEQLSVRNLLLPAYKQLVFKQVIHFGYADGARMLTVGGVICEQGELPYFHACRFDQLPFVKTGDDSFYIEVPCLTPVEMRHLNSSMPSDDSSKIVRKGIPERDVRKYADLYRHFPTFGEIVSG